MAKVVLSRMDKLDLQTTLEKVKICETADQLTKEERHQDMTFVMPDTPGNLQVAGNDVDQVYIPSTLLTESNSALYVYFDLENYAFYQKMKEIIAEEVKPKGVFRFRRMVKQNENTSLLAGDLYVLSSLLGEVKDIQVKQTNQSVAPAHFIIMMNFGGGTMAHIEYTVTDHERIELEWSGMKQILEFDSDEVSSVQAGSHASLSLSYPVDSILAAAHQVDQELVDRLDYFKTLIHGGAPK